MSTRASPYRGSGAGARPVRTRRPPPPARWRHCCTTTGVAVVTLTIGIAVVTTFVSAVRIRGEPYVARGVMPPGLRFHELPPPARRPGDRVALGADRRDVVRAVMGRGVRPALRGVATGLPAAPLLTRAVGGFLVGVSPLDPLTDVAVALAFGGVALVAASVPARRTTTVDPVVALRRS